MKMKTLSRVLLVALCASGLSAPAALYNRSFTPANGSVPNGDPVGWSDVGTVSGIADTVITDVNVRLTITGGYNGDLYVYLAHSSGFSVLLNRAGRTAANPLGHGDAGFDITFDDGGADIHNYTYNGGAQLTGTYEADGRAGLPGGAGLNTDTRSAFLSSFNGRDPNGTWTLFVADMSGDALAPSVVGGWQLDIQAVPEPTHVALGIFGALWLTVLGVKIWKKRRSAAPA